MKKYLLTAAFAVSALLLSNSINYAEEVKIQETPQVNKEMKHPDFKGPHHNFHKKKMKHHLTKEEMEAKKAEFEKRLNLTEEQKQKIEENKKQDIEKMKPLFEEMKAKRHAMRMIDFDATLSAEQKQIKKDELKSELTELRKKADNYREENMKNFEALLTDKQLKEFKKIQEEQKKDMEKRKAEFEKKMKNKKDFHFPHQPKTIPLAE